MFMEVDIRVDLMFYRVEDSILAGKVVGAYRGC